MGDLKRLFRKDPKREQKLLVAEETKTIIQEQPEISVVPATHTSGIPDTKQGTQKVGPIQSNSSKGSQKKYDSSQKVGRKDTSVLVSSVPYVADAKQQAEEQHRKKLLRRQIRKALDDLLERGKDCEASQILSFIETFSSDVGLVREVLSQFQFGERETYPFSVIWPSVSHPSDNPLAELRQQLEIHALVDRLTQQRDKFSTILPTPLVFQVSTTEQGPQFATCTPEGVRSHIQALLGKDTSEFQMLGAFPFLHPGDYPLQLDFSHGITLPITLHLQAQPDAFSEDCAEDFAEVQPLAVPITEDLKTFLQDHLASNSSDDVIAYGTALRIVLVTTYYCGYGKTPWAQELLQEWRCKREEYRFKVGESEIQAVLEPIHRRPWVLPEWLDTKPIDGDALQEYIHAQLAQDPVLARYSVESAWEENDEQTGFKLKIVWLGRSVGTIELLRGDSLSAAEKEENRRRLQMFDLLFSKTLTLSSVVGQSSRALQSFQKFVKTLRQEVPISQPLLLVADRLPTDLSALRDRSKNNQSNAERAKTFLGLARAYGAQGHEVFFCYALAEYCFFRGRQYRAEAKRARSYLQAFLFLYSQMSSDGQFAFHSDLYRSVALYFGSYTFPIDPNDGASNDIATKFYTCFLQTLANMNQGHYETLGHCLVGLSAVNPRFVFDLIKRVKDRKDTTKQLQAMTLALQVENVFKIETTACLHLLSRINTSTIANTLVQKPFSTLEERHRIVHALLSVASAANAPSAETLLQDFAAQASNERRSRVAFSLLVEPFVLNTPDKESVLKAHLVAEALGLTSDKVSTEYFLSKAIQLSQLFDRFFGSQDPNVKGQFAITILETIHSTRKRLMNDLPKNAENKAQRELLQMFLNGIQNHVTAEQSKLISYDTTLVIVLVSDRTLYSPQHTRITIEIRKVDEGIAENLNLEVRPVDGKYQVEERNRLEMIDVLDSKTPLQKELFIQPLVNINESIDLDLILRYDTLKTKAKEASLATNNRTVWFYPENQFVRVPQNYITSAPATTWFYGRKEQLESMADNLRTGTEHDSSLIVHGLKRAGKTSVVKRFITHTFRERELDKTHVPIYVDLLRHPRLRTLRTDGNFLYFLIELLFLELTVAQKTPLPFTLPQIQEKFWRDPFMAFSFYLEKILQGFRDKRVILVLDEFSALYDQVAHPTEEKALTPDLFSFLSNTIQSTYQLTFIFTGTYMLFDMMRNYMFDLWKICKSRMISFLDDTSARRLIEEPVKRNPDDSNRGWLEYDPRVIDRIVTYTHCHPYLIQCLCGLLVDRMNDLKYDRVNLNDLEAIVSDVITKPAHEALMLNMWNDFDVTQQKVLSVIADLTTPVQNWVEINEISAIFKEFKETISLDAIGEICTSLTDAELLEKNTATSDQNEAYCITVPLYQKWLKHNKSPRTVFGNRSPLTSPN